MHVGDGARAWTRSRRSRTPRSRKRASVCDEVFKMREAQAELEKLLTAEEARSLTLSEVFRPFDGPRPSAR